MEIIETCQFGNRKFSIRSEIYNDTINPPKELIVVYEEDIRINEYDTLIDARKAILKTIGYKW